MKEKDLLQELGYLALATRLKRVSDQMIHSGRQMYKKLGQDVEPNWYMIFKLLIKHGQLSVTEISSELGFSHPSIITIINKMSEKDYLVSEKSKDDARKQLISLSDKAKKKLPELEVIWKAGTLGVQNMMEGHDILGILNFIEMKLDEENFAERTFEYMNK